MKANDDLCIKSKYHHRG